MSGSSGTVTESDSGTGDAAVCPSSGPRAAPSGHRAQALACSTPKTQSCIPAYEAGTGQACASDSDCAGDGSFTYYTHCLRGACAPDQCADDSDCASNELCSCASQYYGGNACFHANQCVPANCHVDADCGPGGYCSPSIGYCGAPSGFHCQKPTDPCVDPSVDCGCSKQQIPACVYAPASNNWVCGEGSVCAG
jgi:hypothetical protein